MRKVMAVMLVIAGLLGAAGSAGALTLVENGAAHAKIYLLDGADAEDGKLTAQAAAELAEVLRRMSGAEIPVVKVAGARQIDAAAPAIVLGELAEQGGLKMDRQSPARDGFRIKVSGKRLSIVGESDRGVYHGVYALLETLGCGWYLPYSFGEVIPQQATVRVPDDLDHSEVSDSIHREFWGDGNWALKNKGWLRVGTWRHAWAGLVPRLLFEEHPGMFALINGKRNPRQLCTTNPETIRVAAETLLKRMDAEAGRMVFECGPNDGGGLCQCDKCRELQTPGYIEYTSGGPCNTDAILKFANDLAEITAKKHPDKYLGFYIYSEYSRPPVKVKTVHPNVFPMVAPIRRCRLHGPGNPVCPTNMVLQDEIKVWAKMTDRLGFYPYNFNLADSLLPWTKIDAYRRYQAVVRDLHIKLLAWTPESMGVEAVYGPHLYLSQRIMWNSQLDIDAEMDRFYRGLYGGAYVPMKRYWTRLDAAFANANEHTGAQHGMHQVLTGELLKGLRADIEEAKQAARDDRERQAVVMAETGLRSGEIFMGIRAAVCNLDFATAKARHEELREHVKANAKAGLNGGYSWNYYAGQLGRVVEKGFASTDGGAKILVRLPDVWKFTRDEQATGTERGYFTPEFDAAGWQDLATFSKTWDDQGLGWYRGESWYRSRFPAPQAAQGTDIRLWLGGFDGKAVVYLNGRLVGEQGGFMSPADFKDVAGMLVPGENVIAIRMIKLGLNELGTGGLMMPVMLYVPGAAAAPIDPKTGEGAGYQM
jgi:hypothetical protein